MPILKRFFSILSCFLLLCCIFSEDLAARDQGNRINNVVLLQGAYWEMNYWSKVVFVLQRNGYEVRLIHLPLFSLATDENIIHAALSSMQGGVLLVGPAGGSLVIRELFKEPKIKKVLYVDLDMEDLNSSDRSLLFFATCKGELNVQRMQTDLTGLMDIKTGNVRRIKEKQLLVPDFNGEIQGKMKANWPMYKSNWRLFGIREPLFISELQGLKGDIWYNRWSSDPPIFSEIYKSSLAAKALALCIMDATN